MPERKNPLEKPRFEAETPTKESAGDAQNESSRIIVHESTSPTIERTIPVEHTTSKTVEEGNKIRRELGLILQEGIHDQFEKLPAEKKLQVSENGIRIVSMLEAAHTGTEAIDEQVIIPEIKRWLESIGFDAVYAQAEAVKKAHELANYKA